MQQRDLGGRRVGGFELGEALGRGGFATVYRARQVRLDRDVAVKVLDAELALNPEAARRFEREGQSAAQLEHPNIVPVYEAGDEDGIVYLAMRLVQGPTLEDRLREDGPPTTEELTRLVGAIAAALDHAHAHDLVHRDVKPSNILLEGDSVWLADFGIAATTRDVGRYTTGTIGTASYMAPEQAEATEVDGRADLYSLGCVVFECATGMVPYPGDDLLTALLAHRTEPIPSTDEPSLDEFFERALAKDREERFQSGAEMAAALGAALGGAAAGGFGVPLDATVAPVAAVPHSRSDRASEPGPGAAETVRDPLEPTQDGSPPDQSVTAGDPTGPGGPGTDDRPASGSRRGLVVGLAALVLVVVAGVAYALLGTPDDPDDGSDTEPDDVALVVPGGGADVAFDFSLDDLNPHRSVSAEPVVSGHVLPTLVGVMEDFTVEENALAGTPDVEADPLVDGGSQVVRYRLRDDAVWSEDGETSPITAIDVERTWQYILDDPSQVNVGKTFYERIESIDVVDDKEFVVSFAEPVAPYSILFSTIHPILKADHLDAYLAAGNPPEAYLKDDIAYSGGPYRLSDFAAGSEVVLVRNEDWWGDPPNLDRVEIQFVGDSNAQIDALADRSVDLAYLRFPTPTQVLEAAELEDTVVTTGRSEQWAALLFNHLGGSGPTTEPAVREAISHALNRDTIVGSVVTPVTGEASRPLESLVYVEEQAEYEPAFERYAGDVNEAARILDEAGWVEVDGSGLRRRDGQDLQIGFVYDQEDEAADALLPLVSALESQLARAGIGLVREPVDNPTYNERLFTGNFQTALVLYFTNPDPSNAVIRLAADACPSSIPGCTAPIGGNWGAYMNDEVTAKLHLTDATLDPVERERLFHEIEETLVQDLPALPLYQLPAFVAHDAGLADVDFPPLRGGPLNTLTDWGLLAEPTLPPEASG